MTYHIHSSVEAEVPWYQTRSKTFDCIRGVGGPLSDSMSSCGWLTPQLRVGSASCSTTPCCSTYCRNTPIAEDCLQEDDYVAAVASSLPMGVVESSHDSRSYDSFSRDATSSALLLADNCVTETETLSFHPSPRAYLRNDDVPSTSVSEGVVQNLVCSEGGDTSLEDLRTFSTNKE